MKLTQPVKWLFNYGVKSSLTKEELIDMLFRKLGPALRDWQETPVQFNVEVRKNAYVGGWDSINVWVQAKFRGFGDAVLLADRVEDGTEILKVDDILSMECLNLLEEPDKFVPEVKDEPQA